MRDVVGRRQPDVASEGLTSPTLFRTFSPATRQDPRRRSAWSWNAGGQASRSPAFPSPHVAAEPDDQGSRWQLPQQRQSHAGGRRRCRAVVGKHLPPAWFPSEPHTGRQVSRSRHSGCVLTAHRAVKGSKPTKSQQGCYAATLNFLNHRSFDRMYVP